MRTISIIALIAAIVSPALAAPTPTAIAPDSAYGMRDPGDHEDRAGIFRTAELFGAERDGRDISMRDIGDRTDRDAIFGTAGRRGT